MCVYIYIYICVCACVRAYYHLQLSFLFHKFQFPNQEDWVQFFEKTNAAAKRLWSTEILQQGPHGDVVHLKGPLEN